MIEPTDAMILAFMKAQSTVEDGVVLHDKWKESYRAGLKAAFAVYTDEPTSKEEINSSEAMERFLADDQ